jgi:hypothetical protein
MSLRWASQACVAGGGTWNMSSVLMTAYFFIARASGETDFDFGASK